MDGIGGFNGVGEVGVVGDERGGWRKAAPHPGSSPRPEMSLPWFLGKRGNVRIVARLSGPKYLCRAFTPCRRGLVNM